MTSADISSDIDASVRILTGHSARMASRCAPSGNSRVFKVELETGDTIALKFYPPLAHDPRDRLGVEYAALNFLSASTSLKVPRPVASNRANNMAAYEWIDGERPEPSTAVIDAMLGFMAEVSSARFHLDAEEIGLATECCLSGSELISQIDRRLCRLESLANETELSEFLDDDIRPQLVRIELPTDILPQTLRCLNPGDFGAHNMLATNSGFAFIDMEYFGWDDPVKQICDVILHPGMRLDDDLLKKFLRGSIDLYQPHDPEIKRRISDFFPAYNLRWTLIILNEFLPERWLLRAHGGNTNQSVAKRQQLAKARSMVACLSERQVMVESILGSL